jgi:GH15 family glucan-1,4-alpha-glucosidase
MDFRVECLPAFDYARRDHTVSVGKTGAVFAAEGHCLGLATHVRLAERARGAAGAHFTLGQGERATFVLAHLEQGEGPGEILSDVGFEELLHSTLRYWRRWLSNSIYQGRWREIVLRDAALALYALIYVGFEDEARKFMGWLRDRCQEDADGLLQPLYGIDGRKDMTEVELTHLSGYMNSFPVRLGNGAYEQRQLDLYGAVLDAAYLYNKHGAPLDYDLWKNLAKILDWLSENWRGPDEGIWEVRGGRRQFVNSKLMSWVALERAGRIARQRGLPAGNGRWMIERDAVYEEVMEKGWNPERKSFVQYYGSDALDASLLMMPLVKFVGPTDPRWLSTLDRIQQELAFDTLVERYKTKHAAPDGLEGGEGSFSLCSFWLVECLTRAGRLDEARLALEKMFSYANHLELYAEEIGHSGEALGNFPQAFTHLALISAAVHLDRALGAR